MTGAQPIAKPASFTEQDLRPVALIPAYRPESAIVGICAELIKSQQFAGVVCVDDGSGPDFGDVFQELRQLGATVLTHMVNLGKGAAIRTGANHAGCRYPKCIGIVTLDADGQHLAADVLSVARALMGNPNKLVMGCRQFEGDVPLRSRFGNSVTRFVMRVFGRVRVSDTQTGLRGIPRTYLPTLLRLSTSRYEFETDMLMQTRAAGIEILEVPIATVYIQQNRSSSFRPLIDSARIYYVLLRHIGNSIATAGIDYAAFSILLLSGTSLLWAILGGRCVAGLFNYFVGRALVFKSGRNLLESIVEYVVLVLVLLFFSYSAIVFLTERTTLSPFAAKLIVESVLFIVAFAAQKAIVFRRDESMSDVTDWDKYYQSRAGISAAAITRRVSERLILSLLRRHLQAPPGVIVELGGGDSCFYPALRRLFPAAEYIVVDNSKEGIQQFMKKAGQANCRAIEADLLASPSLPKGDLVLSVGLIEHFDPVAMARIVKMHFELARPHGLVLFTYPTPRGAYRPIRRLAELLGIWRFPDERPLRLAEIMPTIIEHGRLLESRLNWLIGLTQEIVVAAGHPADPDSTG